MNIFKHNLYRIFGAYIGIILFFSLILWGLFNLETTESGSGMHNALITTMGLKIPPALASHDFSIAMFIIIVGSIFISIVLLALNIFFSAVITTKMIRPRIDILTSTKGVLSNQWDKAKTPYILVRLINANIYDLVKVNVKAVVTIEEHVETDEGLQKFIFYFDIEDKDLDPSNVLILKSHSPWSIAIPAEIKLANSIRKNYYLHLGQKQSGVFPEYKPVYVKRKIEFLISGNESMSSSAFTSHKEIDLDIQRGDEYELLLHEGTFKSLDVLIDDVTQIEKYIDTRGNETIYD